LKKNLVEKVIEKKIEKGLITLASRDQETESHLTRSIDSLNDTLADLEKVVPEKAIKDLETVDNPVINDNVETRKMVTESTEKAKNDKNLNKTRKANILLSINRK
jgi:hypothetical protein